MKNIKIVGLQMFLSLIVFVHSDEEELENGFCSTTKCETQIQFNFINETLNNFEQEDPRLIEEIKKLIVNSSPKSVPYNFTAKKLDLRGQFSQAEIISEYFKDVKNGFFIEAGAYDGETYSNSLYFEIKQGWSGLLVEPNPDALKELLMKNRKSQIFGHCFSTKTKPEVVDFDAAGLIGGIINEGKKPGDDPIDERELRNRPKNYKPQHPFNRRTIRIQCFPFYSVLMALGNPTVDIFSLDIEGAEFQVLQTIPWDKVDIRSLILEVVHAGTVFDGNRFQIRKFVKEKGYKLIKSIAGDEIYVRKDILNK